MKVKLYRKYLFMYGITTLIMVLEHFERLENYEECQLIVEAIREQEERLDIKLWTRNTEETLTEVLTLHKEGSGLSISEIQSHSKYYANIVIDEINKL